MKIHLLDSDKKTFEQLNKYFYNEHALTFSNNARDTFDYLQHNDPDLVILDVILPETDGFEVCKTLHNEYPLMPIIILTEKDDDFNKIVGLEVGADDFISKPFNPRVLSARLKAIKRRLNINNKFFPSTESKMVFSEDWNITLNPENRSVNFQGKTIGLTFTEFEILRHLLNNIGVIQTRETLIKKFAGLKVEVSGRLIDTYIKRLRQKLNDCSRMIKTVWGVGYVINKF